MSFPETLQLIAVLQAERAFWLSRIQLEVAKGWSEPEEFTQRVDQLTLKIDNAFRSNLQTTFYQP